MAMAKRVIRLLRVPIRTNAAHSEHGLLTLMVHCRRRRRFRRSQGIESKGTWTLIVRQSNLAKSHEVFPGGHAGEMFRQHVGYLGMSVDVLDSNAVTGTNLNKPIDIDPVGPVDMSQC